MWLGTGASGGLFWIQQWTLGCRKRRQISWLNELLSACQEGLCCKELVERVQPRWSYLSCTVWPTCFSLIVSANGLGERKETTFERSGLHVLWRMSWIVLRLVIFMKSFRQIIFTASETKVCEAVSFLRSCWPPACHWISPTFYMSTICGSISMFTRARPPQNFIISQLRPVYTLVPCFYVGTILVHLLHPKWCAPTRFPN
jgi:hypothetical protein